MIKKLLFPLFALSLLGSLLFPSPTYAEPTCETILGAPAWNCNIETEKIKSQDDLKKYIPMIATNILNAITVAASYLVIGYIIYGGYLYIFSGGDTTKVATGKKALNQAFIGLAITLSATVIFSAIRIALGGQLNPNHDATDTIMNLVNWVISISGIIATVFVIGGGIMYATSQGDSGKLQKAKNMIIYSLIGLAIVALSFTISSFMSSTINNANKPTSYLITNEKEQNEII